MDEQVFADGIGTISMIGGTVRIDFLSYSPTEMDASGQPKPVFRQRIIMGLEAFLATADKIGEAAKALAARTAPASIAPSGVTPVPPSIAPAPSLAAVQAAPEPSKPQEPPPSKPPFP